MSAMADALFGIFGMRRVEMTNGPESKAAEEYCQKDCPMDENCNAVKCAECLMEIIIHANAAHYLPLLREIQRELLTYFYPSQKSHGADCECLGCRAAKEITRLEAGAKGGE